MSQFLGFESYLIPLGASKEDVHNTLKTALTSKGWQVIHDSLLVRAESIIGDFGTDANKRIVFQDVMPFSPAWVDYSNNTVSNWIGLKHTAAVNIRSVVIHGDAVPNNNFRDFTVDYSDDGITWNTAATFVNTLWPDAYVRREFKLPDSGSHQYWRVFCTATEGNSTKSVCRIQFHDLYGNFALAPDYDKTWFDIIPPITETIGDLKSRELVRFSFSGTAITVVPVCQAMKDYPQAVYINENTNNSGSGINGNSVTITDALGNTVTISQDPATLNLSNTARQNLIHLYTAVKSSSDTLAVAYDWSFNTPASQNGAFTTSYILGIAKSSNTLNKLSGTNVDTGSTGYPSFAGMVQDYSTPIVRSLPIDLINGFIYYLQINARGLALATKTNSVFSSVTHACYANHASAMSVLPDSSWCSVIELLVGQDDDANNTDSWAAPAHTWAVTDRIIKFRMESYNNSYSSSHARHMFNHMTLRHTMYDSPLSAYDNDRTIQLMGSNLWVDNDTVGNDFQIHRLSNPRITTWSDGWVTCGTYIVPQLDIEDWFKFRGTAVNEALVMVADTQVYTTLEADITSSDTITTLTVGNTTGFNSTGFVAIGDEIFQYTGISGNDTLTGVTRAKYGSSATPHYTKDSVHMCLWFTIIGGGAILCGYNKPV